MSILIADSGATKTEWCIPGNGTFKTEGLNPYYHTTESIREVIEKDLLPKLKGKQIEKVFFYGAGCDGNEKKQVVLDALQANFRKSEIAVYHDLLGAARACFLNEPGIACILGTGSNSCLYDGTEIVEHIHSLAFILGDEGSAAWFGKQLVNKYFRFEVPDDLKADLEENYNMSMEHITKGVYDGSQKSRFIASYASFLGEHVDHPFIREMLHEGFENFLTRIVMKYSNAENNEVRFIGSVAYAYQDIIKNILQKNGMKAGLFIQKPMDRLVEFHTKHE